MTTPMKSKMMGWTRIARNQNTIPTMTIQPRTVSTMRKRLNQTDVEDAPPSAVFSRSGNEDMIAPLFSSRRPIDTSPLRAPPSSVDVGEVDQPLCFPCCSPFRLQDKRRDNRHRRGSEREGQYNTPSYNRVYRFRNENTSSERAIFVRFNGASTRSRLHSAFALVSLRSLVQMHYAT